MNSMERIKELEQELMRVRLGIVEDEKEFKELDKKIKEREIKMKLCDFIIYNDEQKLLIPQVIELHQKLLRLAEEKPLSQS